MLRKILDFRFPRKVVRHKIMHMTIHSQELTAVCSYYPSGLNVDETTKISQLKKLAKHSSESWHIFRARIKLKKVRSKNCYTKLILCSNLHFCIAIFSVINAKPPQNTRIHYPGTCMNLICFELFVAM